MSTETSRTEVQRENGMKNKMEQNIQEVWDNNRKVLDMHNVSAQMEKKQKGAEEIFEVNNGGGFSKADRSLLL